MCLKVYTVVDTHKVCEFNLNTVSLKVCFKMCLYTCIVYINSIKVCLNTQTHTIPHIDSVSKSVTPQTNNTHIYTHVCKHTFKHTFKHTDTHNCVLYMCIKTEGE